MATEESGTDVTRALRGTSAVVLARSLGVPAAVVMEDALAGVQAGRQSGFGLVVGVDRTHAPGTRSAPLKHGAGLVVDDLAELLATED
ncbi:hypothetical protein [Streptomyces sp. NBC_00035]|uniref:hypothetical protein n=1 Tax=Streptomyces sp. NBC_00035 TaxID=2903614 RepID=UPI00386EE374